METEGGHGDSTIHLFTISAAITAAKATLYFRNEKAEMAVVEATASGYQLRGSYKIKLRSEKSGHIP